MTCMTGSTFAYASAQAVCAVSVCSEASSHSNIAMILDASLLLGSVFVLLSSVTRTVRSLPSLQAC